jgi:hypothetical protein
MKRAPAFSILGSFFPGWLACIVAGVLLAVLVRFVLNRLDWERLFRALPVVYLCLSLLFASSFWLLFFE